jgi:glycosyltransferase involved in cell wall biosynthesis
MPTPISVLILTKNEEHFIARCIASVSWADEVLVLDSGSDDATRAIAEELGATVYVREWKGWARQHAEAVALAANDWVLNVDSDEVVSPQLRRSILQVTEGTMDPKNAYSMDRRGDFLGILLPNTSRRKKRVAFVRLFNRRFSRWDETMKVHEEVRVPGRVIPLDGVLIHWRAYTLDEYGEVFNRYAAIEAEVLDDRGVQARARQIALRPLARFGWCYIRKQEFRLGARGLIHAMLMAFQEYLRYAKLWERQHASKTLDPTAEVLAAHGVAIERGGDDPAGTGAVLEP